VVREANSSDWAPFGSQPTDVKEVSHASGEEPH
jgi:hypothetical protein